MRSIRRTLSMSTGALAIAFACGSILAGPTAAHPPGVSDVPEGASAPSDPLLVHRALEAAKIKWYPGYDEPAEGCPDYRPNASGSLDPVFASCALDRLSMFEHSASCTESYARNCVEQILPTKNIPRGRGFAMYGVLYGGGQPVPSQEFVLERAILGVDAAFKPFSRGITSATGEIGSRRVNDVARSKTAYRWGAVPAGGTALVYTTVPMVTLVQPTIKSTNVDRRQVKRRQRFHVNVTTDVPIWSTVRLEYKLGSRWIQVSRYAPLGKTRFTIPGRIDRTGGSFPIRIVIDKISRPGRPWYDGATRNLGALKVLDSWTVVG